MKALMQILKWAIITMLAFTSFNLFISPEYKLARSVEINVPAHIVYEQVTDLHQWENWAVWWKNDTSMITNYSGAERGLGAKMIWTSDVVRDGDLEIIECSSQAIKTKLAWGNGSWHFEETENGTNVTWSMNGKMPFLMRFMTMFIEDMVGPDFEKGLTGLKELCESIPAKTID
jgi:uncharacterized membrane protein